MTLKLRNAFLRGWFAARSRRAMPAPDGMEEKVYIDSGFDAGMKSPGAALPLLDQVNPNDLRAAWQMEFDLEKSRLQRRYLDVLLPGTGRPSLDLDLRDAAGAAHTVPPEIEAPGPQSRSRWDEDGDTAPPVNRFLPTRKYGAGAGRKARFKG